MFNPVSNILSREPLASTKLHDIADEIATVANKQGTMLAGTGGLQLRETASKRRYFCVPMEQQKELDFTEVRRSILKELDLPADTKIAQVIGDSGRFSPLGTKIGAKFLKDHLSDDQLLLWGYTGKPVDDRGCTEVNQLVTEWLESRPARFRMALANVVDLHTPLAIREWKCSIGVQNQNFFLVHGGATFGKDIESSDALTEKAFCLEGGIQSFAQIVNFLSRDVSVSGIYNMRGENNPDTFHEGMGGYLTYFSAGEFIDLLQKELLLKGELTFTQVEKFKDNYLQGRYLYNPSRKDAPTKQGLWDKAWKSFVEQKLWLKLSLCQFKNVGRTIDQFITKKGEQKRVIITGGPGTGKTTTLEEFRQHRIAVVAEAATDVIIHEQNNGVIKPWEKEGFREKIAELQRTRRIEAQAKRAELVLFDRSEIDTLTYCFHLGCEPTNALVEAIQRVVDERFYYKQVFLLDNLGVSNQTDVRCEDESESQIIQMRLEDSYKKLGFRVIRVPARTVQERVDFIAKWLERGL